MIRAALTSRRVLTALSVFGVVALVVAACSRDLPTSPPFDSASRRLAAAATSPTLLFGPVVYTRATGAPRVDSASFAAVVGDTLTVQLASTAPRGLNAWIRVNGVRIFETGSGRTLPDSMKVVARERNAVEVWMGGKPGSSVRVSITTPRPATPPPTHTMTVITGASAIGLDSAGTFTLNEGERFHYAFRPAAGFDRLKVLLDGQPVADSGVVLMDQPHWLAASADTVVTLDAGEATLSQMLRATLSSATPRESWVAFQQSVRTQSASWGTASERHMARVFYASLDPIADLPALVRLDSAIAGLVEDVPIPETGALANASTTSRAARRAATRSVLGPAAPAREPVHVLVVNGILSFENDVSDVASSIASRIARDPVTFPRGTVTVSHYWNRTLSVGAAVNQAARFCSFLVGVQSSARGIPVLGAGALGVPDLLAKLLTCVAQSDLRNIDLIEAMRWIQQAQVGEPQRDVDIVGLAALMKLFSGASKHLVVLAHSEGSVLTQLAALRLKSDYGFNETTSPYCVGTISVAGAGTANWPLSDRRSRFVVAKHDIVTLLPSPWGNTRPTFEDSDTRAADSTFAMIQQATSSDGSTDSGVALAAARLFAGQSIHSFLRYINRDEDWQIISGHLDDLYRTCAIGQVMVEPNEKTLQLYGRGDFTARWAALDGLPLPTADTVVWSTDSSLATVAPSGRATAGVTVGSSVGVAPLVAQVRRATDSAMVTISDDSLVATYVPPTINSVTTRRTFYIPPIDYEFNDAVHPAALWWYMSISATAMPGATIENVEVRHRLNAAPDSEVVAYSGPLTDEEIVYQALSYLSDGTPIPSAYDTFAKYDFSWYRVIITDSHGLKSEFIGTSADPNMLVSGALDTGLRPPLAPVTSSAGSLPRRDGPQTRGR